MPLAAADLDARPSPQNKINKDSSFPTMSNFLTSGCLVSVWREIPSRLVAQLWALPGAPAGRLWGSGQPNQVVGRRRAPTGPGAALSGCLNIERG